jgi:energy-coupling factor transport system permease protein
MHLLADVDPRSRLAVTMCLTTMAVIIRSVAGATMLLLAGIVALMLFGIGKDTILRVIKKLAPVIGIVALIQILLVKGGEPFLVLWNVRIVTSGGLLAAFFMIVRVIMIASCGFIISSIEFGSFLLGMKALRVPYEIAFMAAMGIKFVPSLGEEMRDSLISAQLRGADISKMGIVGRIRLYGAVLMPTTVAALMRAEQISWALELKGFNPGSKRSCWRKLSLKAKDWLVIGTSIGSLAIFFIINYVT